VKGFLKATLKARAGNDLKTLNLLVVGTRGDTDQIKKLAEAITSADG
jgi:hypothetical protein